MDVPRGADTHCLGRTQKAKRHARRPRGAPRGHQRRGEYGGSGRDDCAVGRGRGGRIHVWKARDKVRHARALRSRRRFQRRCGKGRAGGEEGARAVAEDGADRGRGVVRLRLYVRRSRDSSRRKGRCRGLWQRHVQRPPLPLRLPDLRGRRRDPRPRRPGLGGRGARGGRAGRGRGERGLARRALVSKGAAVAPFSCREAQGLVRRPLVGRGLVPAERWAVARVYFRGLPRVLWDVPSWPRHGRLRAPRLGPPPPRDGSPGR
mmetsp:Transcript_1366/g.4827  ORF Transcript_1366/g.4827 Transcript_1366/m.4827 type:complete len:262 (-) Transcript_1366:32-817(-)